MTRRRVSHDKSVDSESAAYDPAEAESLLLRPSLRRRVVELRSSPLYFPFLIAAMFRFVLRIPCGSERTLQLPEHSERSIERINRATRRDRTVSAEWMDRFSE